MSRKLTKKERKELKKKNNLLEVKETCVNCNQFIALDQRFCAHCGGKRIYNRLTWRNLIEDFLDRFLNLENSFLKTFIAMCTKPDDVIGGYINGMRKKYLPAFSYFAIAISLTGFYYYLLKGWFFDNYLTAQTSMFTEDIPEFQLQIQESFSTTLMDNQSLYMFLIIPVFAVISRLVFWNYNKYNLVEHFVIFLYTYSHISIISVVLQLIFIWSPTMISIIGLFIILLLFFYTAYVLKKLFTLDTAGIVLKTGLFGAMVGLILVIGTVGIFVMGLQTLKAYKSGEIKEIDQSSMMGKILNYSIEQAEAQKQRDSLQNDNRQNIESSQEILPAQ